MHVTAILNPTAGGGSAGRRRGAVAAALAAAGLDAQVRCTTHPGHAVELAAEAAAASEAVIAVGGDGTVQEVSRGLLASGHDTPLAVLPLGTGNDFAKMLRLPRGGLRAAARALATALPTRVDVGRVVWEEGGRRERLFINAVGLGFDARVADVAADFKHLPGLAAYLAAVFHTLRRWQAPGVVLHADGAVLYEGRLFLVTAGNGVSSGGGFYLTPEASLTDGLLDVCLIEDVRRSRVFQLIPRALVGRHGTAPEVHTRRAAHLHLTADAPLFIHTDGEVLTKSATTVDIWLEAGRLPVLMPG